MKLLFVCTHNRCRSILAEAITRHICGESVASNSRPKLKITAASAGSKPVGAVHPLTLAALTRHNISCQGLSSKSWDDLEGFDPDVLITVCDKASEEHCPLWLGDAMRVHWGLADPSQTAGSEQQIEQAFDQTIQLISQRIQVVNSWDTASLSQEKMHKQLAALA